MSNFKTILDAMDRTDEWVCDHYHLQHQPSGICFWIASGFVCFRCQNSSLSLNPWYKWRLWRKSRKLRTAIVARQLTSVTPVITDSVGNKWEIAPTVSDIFEDDIIEERL